MADRLKAIYDNARKMTFTYNGVEITVRESLGIDKMDMSVFRRFVREKLLSEQETEDSVNITINDIDWNRIVNFVAIVARTVEIKGKMNFKLPTASDSKDVWYESYWQFLILPSDLMQVWDDTLASVNKVEPDPEV
jgi:hypothetical protein